MKEIAKDYYEEWFKHANECLIDVHNILLRDNLNKCAFELHQAMESLYSIILLVFSNYKPKSHDIEELGSMAGNYDNELWTVFPQLNEEQKNVLSCFKRHMLMRDMMKTIKLLKNSFYT
ncbi:MAG: hypothetical protein PG979_001539 [Rickettsia asembonensis]|nr:MAG: hypothetical protein PG979_001539 [Rickettsia asembonensis]